MTASKPIKFTHFLLLRIVIMCVIALSISIPITIAIGYNISNNAFKKHIQQQHDLLEKGIKQKLVTGWVPKDLEKILLNLNTSQANNQYFFIPDNSLGISQIELMTPELQTTLHTIEEQKQDVINKNFTESKIIGGFPIFLEPHCIQCHPGRKIGEYAGTVLFSSKMEEILLTWSNVTFFFVFFLATFIGVGSIIMIRILNTEMIKPLTNISDRIFHLRIEDVNVQWQREPKHILEVDRIDEYLYHNISMLKNIHEKLDALFVTEHESGFFHENRFKEAVQYEIYRSERYEHPFSILIIKLLSIAKLDENRHETITEKIHLFAKLIRKDIRDADMPFRVGKQLFIIITPETDEKQVPEMAKSFSEKFRPSRTQELDVGYQFEIQVGYATFGYDAKNSKDLSKVALQRLKTDIEEN